MSFWGQRTFCLVTGASRGIGATIAIEFAKKVGPGSAFLLVARSSSDLEETKEAILAATTSRPPTVFTRTMDLGNPTNGKTAYLDLITSYTKDLDPSTFDHALLVHNAGNAGNTSIRILEMEDLEEIQNYWAFNLTSLILLTSQFFKVFNDKGKQRSVVQISSLAGIEAYPTWGFYCAGKAARDMLMKVLAKEEEGIQVLNYAPGPVATEMFDKVTRETGDPGVREVMEKTKEGGSLLTTLQTVTKLVGVLESKKFVKGEHVDYFDIQE